MSNIVWGFPSPGQTVIEDGYSYKEVAISSAELITPLPTISGNTGKDLLQPLTGDQYYEWKMNIEFIPGSIPYDPTNNWINIFGSAAVYPGFSLIDLNTNIKLVLQLSSSSPSQDYNSGGEAYPDRIGTNNFLCMQYNSGLFVNGNGTMKVKIWYKTVNFG